MVTGVYAARNIAGESYDIWDVNVEADYHEEQRRSDAASGDRLVPERVSVESVDDLIASAFARYDATALGAAIGTTLGIGLFLATVMLLLQGGVPMGPNLSLLGNVFFGYTVSWSGAFIGLVEASVGGFAFGWALAKVINWIISRTERDLIRRIEVTHTLDLFEGDVT